MKKAALAILLASFIHLPFTYAVDISTDVQTSPVSSHHVINIKQLEEMEDNAEVTVVGYLEKFDAVNYAISDDSGRIALNISQKDLSKMITTSPDSNIVMVQGNLKHNVVGGSGASRYNVVETRSITVKNLAKVKPTV